MHRFDRGGFIPLETVAVGLGCVRPYVRSPGLDGFSLPIQRRRTILIRVRVEGLSVVASSLAILTDLSQLLFF